MNGMRILLNDTLYRSLVLYLFFLYFDIDHQDNKVKNRSTLYPTSRRFACAWPVSPDQSMWDCLMANIQPGR
jgi:hypothetical protein